MSSKRPLSTEDKSFIREWLETVTGLKFVDPNNFHSSLKDGVILCELIVKLRGLKYANYQKEVHGVSFKEMENIAFFIQNVQKIGVKCEWTIRALHKNSDLDAVLRTVIDLSKHFENKFRNSNTISSTRKSNNTLSGLDSNPTSTTTTTTATTTVVVDSEEVFAGPFLKLPIIFKQPSNQTAEVNTSVPFGRSMLRKVTTKSSQDPQQTSMTTSEKSTIVSTLSSTPTTPSSTPSSTGGDTLNATNAAVAVSSTHVSTPHSSVSTPKTPRSGSGIVTNSTTSLTGVGVGTTHPPSSQLETKTTMTPSPLNNNNINKEELSKTTQSSSGSTTQSLKSNLFHNNGANTEPQQQQWTLPKLRPTNSGNNLKEQANNNQCTTTTTTPSTQASASTTTATNTTTTTTTLNQPQTTPQEFSASRLRPVSTRVSVANVSELHAVLDQQQQQPSQGSSFPNVQLKSTKNSNNSQSTDSASTTATTTITNGSATTMTSNNTGTSSSVASNSNNNTIHVTLKPTQPKDTTNSNNTTTTTTTSTSNHTGFKLPTLKPVVKDNNGSQNNHTSHSSSNTLPFTAALRKTDSPILHSGGNHTPQESTTPSTTPSTTTTPTSNNNNTPTSSSPVLTIKTNTSSSSNRNPTTASLSSPILSSFLHANDETSSSISEEDSDDEDDMSNDQGIAYNIKKLKDQVTNQHPSAEYLYSLYKLLEKKSERWSHRFADQEKGVQYLGEIISTMNQKRYRSVNEKTVQERALKCCHVLIDKGIMEPFIKYPTTVAAMAMMIDSKDGAKIRMMALEILSLICTHGEQGFWAVLEALNRYKIEKKEPKRFHDLIDCLKTERDEKLKTFSLMLLNSLINTPQDSYIRILIRNEMKQVGLEEVVDQLSNDLQHDRIKDENLKEQIKVFEEEMMIGMIEREQAQITEDVDSQNGKLSMDLKNESDPLKLMKLLILRLGASTGTSHLVSILQQFLFFSMRDQNDPKFENALSTSWKNLESTIKTMVQACTMKGDAGIIEDIAKKEKNANFEKQKQTTKITNLSNSLEKANKEIEELKKQVETWKAMKIVKNNTTLSSPQLNQQASQDQTSNVPSNESETNTTTLTTTTTTNNNNTSHTTTIEHVNSLSTHASSSSSPSLSPSSSIPFDHTELFTKEMEELKQHMKIQSDQIHALDSENTHLKTQLKELEEQLEEARRVNFKASLQQTSSGGSGSSNMGTRSPSLHQVDTSLSSSNIVPHVLDRSNMNQDEHGFKPPPPPPSLQTSSSPSELPLTGGGIVPPPPPSPGSFYDPSSSIVPPPPPSSSPSMWSTTSTSTGHIPLPPNVVGVPILSKRNPLPELATRVPKTAVKNFYGTAISKQKVSSTCWVKSGIAASTKDIPLDADELEEVFSNAPRKNISEEEKKKKKEYVSFVEPQKGSALSILLGYIRLDYSEIRRAILEMDEEVLNAQVVDTLKDKMATTEELSLIEAYQGDADLLSPVDKFYLALREVPRLEGRLFCWAFRSKFQSEVSEVLSDLETVLAACTQILQSQKFKKLLSIILAIANFLNANSTSKRNAYGFTLSSLLKLQDTKTSDNKSTLLQYIAGYCAKHFPELLELKDDLVSIEDATRVSLIESDNEYRKLKNGFEQMERELQNEEWNKVSSHFKTSMSEFMESASRFLDDIDSILSKIDEKLRQIAEDFAEDEKTICKNPNELFSQLNTFVNSFRNSYDELVKQKEAEEKRKLKEKLKEEKKKQSAAFFANHTNMMKLKKSKANGAVAGGVAIFEQKMASSVQSPSSSLMVPPSTSNGLVDSSDAGMDVAAISTTPVDSSNSEILSENTRANDHASDEPPMTITHDSSALTVTQNHSDDSSLMSESEQALLQSRIRDRKKSIMSGAAFRERRMTRMSVMENNDNNN
ncbi:hypothetical protein C9374_000875 [Naegleria lovaniensis]|uniref:Uncharacterized protein n=1 Tax=Naegleria lovaniensis TaxID=51637 RepID=A0AA88GSE5_NAELO|nr:uncharacterized protein C9374_000875 [Naegleria lovaniensis]KAG2388025.1 hypothetical protein C9374_000875 [Naegleria lovaniensis]